MSESDKKTRLDKVHAYRVSVLCKPQIV